jgi:hypothetical protein
MIAGIFIGILISIFIDMIVIGLLEWGCRTTERVKCERGK